MRINSQHLEPATPEINVSLLCNFSEATTRIKEHYTLSRFIEDSGVALKKRGREAVGLCPFHEEKTPSFSVNDQKGIYYCRGCGATGDVIKYHATANGVSDGKAISQLAYTLGIMLKSDNHVQFSRSEPSTAIPSRETRATLADLHDHVAELAHRYLLSVLNEPDHPATKYLLEERQFTLEEIYRFGIGFLPPEQPLWALVSNPAPHNPEPVTLPESQWRVSAIEAGLLNGSYQNSMFQGRILFPIANTDGRCVAFSGRVVPALADSVVLGDRKYVNSPETHIFDKSSTLFGLTPWRFTLRDQKTPSQWRELNAKASYVLVEGLTDVLRLTRLGIRAVAAMGTAISSGHLQIILTRADTLIVLTDGDSAGVDAAQKAMLTVLPLLKAGHVAYAACLPDGEDPDSYFCELDDTPNPTEHFWHLANGLHRHLPEEVWFDEYIGHTADPVSIADQVRIERALSPSGPAKIPVDPMWRLSLIRYIADVTGYYTQPLVSLRSAYFTPSAQTEWLLDDSSKFWLYRIARAPEILKPMTRPKLKSWWVKDAVNGLLGAATECPAPLRLIFQAGIAAHKSKEPIKDWSNLVSVLLDVGFPTGLLVAWASVVEDGDRSLASLGYTEEVLSPDLWQVEFEEWVTSIDQSLTAKLFQALNLDSD